MPSRDLLLSPDHAVLVDGALIHAGALVNGNSIVRETQVPLVFTYYHVEADDHALILAQNTPAETFVDNVERLAFDNWAEHEALYPAGKTIQELPYPRARPIVRSRCTFGSGWLNALVNQRERGGSGLNAAAYCRIRLGRPAFASRSARRNGTANSSARFDREGLGA